MKKSVKIILIIIGVLFGLIILDTIQARLFKNSPLLSSKKLLENNSYVDRGILMDTYYCKMSNDSFVVDWYFKFNKFACPIYDNNDSKSIFKTSDNIISLSIKENTLTNKGLTIIIENKSNDKYIYGNSYYLEYYENDKWNIMNQTSNTLEAYGLKPNQKIENTIDWSYSYGELPSGKYRIVKNFLKDNNKKFDIFSSLEFEIN